MWPDRRILGLLVESKASYSGTDSTVNHATLSRLDRLFHKVVTFGQLRAAGHFAGNPAVTQCAQQSRAAAKQPWKRVGGASLHYLTFSPEFRRNPEKHILKFPAEHK